MRQGRDAAAEFVLTRAGIAQGAQRDGARDGPLPDEQAAVVGEPVGLVQQKQHLGGPPLQPLAPLALGDALEEFFEGRLHRLVLELGHRVRDVQHDQEQVGVGGLLERGPEGGDKIVGQIADEAHRIREHDREALAEVPVARARDERGEELVVGEGAPGGEGIEEGALAGVGVAHEADGEVLEVAPANLAALAGLDGFELAAQEHLAVLDEAPVGFELGFAGASGADAADAADADDAFEVVPHGAETGVGVLELCEFDLEFGLVCGGSAGEDVEDEFGAVEDFSADDLFDVGDLPGREVVIEDDEAGVGLLAEVAEFLDLARAHVGSRIGAWSFLDDLGDSGGAGGLGQGAELAQGIARVVPALGKIDGGQNGALLLDLDLGSFFPAGHRVGGGLARRLRVCVEEGGRDRQGELPAAGEGIHPVDPVGV